MGQLALLAATVGLWAGCSQKTEVKSPVVAEVGGRPIELREVTDYLETLYINYPTADAELDIRRRYLNKLIEEQLLVIGGYSQAMDADIGIIELVDREKDKFLLDELFRTEVLEKATVPESAMREAYDHWFDRIQPMHIMVESKASADSLMARINAGEDFGDLAEKYSIDQGTALRGGDFGREFRWGELLAPLQELAFSLAEGQTGGPIQTDFGWHILRVKKRTKVESRPYDSLKTQIESVLKRQYQERRRLEQLDEIRTRANVVLKSEGVTIIRQIAPGLADTVPAEISSYYNIPEESLAPEAKEAVLATFGTDGTVTIEQFVKTFNSRDAGARPDLMDEEDIRETAFQVALYDLLREEALKLKLDQAPLYKERLREFQEKLIADKMRTTLISRNVRVTNEDIRAYFDANPDSFVTPKSYHVREVLVNDEATAENILREAHRGTPLEKLAEKNTMRPGFRKTGGDLGWVLPDRYPGIYEFAQTLKVGEVGGPVPGVGQYSVIEVLEVREPQARTFEDAQNSIFDRLEKLRTDSVITAYKDSVSVLHPVVIYDEVLRSNLAAPKTESVGTQAGRV